MWSAACDQPCPASEHEKSMTQGAPYGMITRTSKFLLVSAIAFLYTLVVFNNLTDFDSNYQFVRHVLSMDSTFPVNHGQWRAIRWPPAHLSFSTPLIASAIMTPTFTC